jgi:glycosyltransferase involved in cell wall biosynthesis
MTLQRTTLVVPCFNEARRLDEAAVTHLLQAQPELGLLFVNDGSTDDTAACLDRIAAARPDRLAVVHLARNVGKAEAVRQGLLRALQGGSAVTGYLDADFATPWAEVARLLRLFEATPDADVLMASRVALLGRDIARSPRRHYLGRVFATVASAVLGLRVYDTQCGAKLFRTNPALELALEEPFLSRWIFDVELLGRLLAGGPGATALPPSRFLEEPLKAWQDVPGSKLRPRHLVTALSDLVRIRMDLAARRARANGRG